LLSKETADTRCISRKRPGLCRYTKCISRTRHGLYLSHAGISQSVRMAKLGFSKRARQGV